VPELIAQPNDPAQKKERIENMPESSKLVDLSKSRDDRKKVKRKQENSGGRRHESQLPVKRKSEAKKKQNNIK